MNLLLLQTNIVQLNSTEVKRFLKACIGDTTHKSSNMEFCLIPDISQNLVNLDNEMLSSDVIIVGKFCIEPLKFVPRRQTKEFKEDLRCLTFSNRKPQPQREHIVVQLGKPTIAIIKNHNKIFCSEINQCMNLIHFYCKCKKKTNLCYYTRDSTVWSKSLTLKCDIFILPILSYFLSIVYSIQDRFSYWQAAWGHQGGRRKFSEVLYHLCKVTFQQFIKPALTK